MHYLYILIVLSTVQYLRISCFPSDETKVHVISEEPDFALEEREKGYERDSKLRMETALKMRDMYREKQKQWAQFREAEQQRRTDKANQEELDRLAAILAHSQAKHEFTKEKFHQTLTVRSFFDAALIIQGAYRRMKARRNMLKEIEMKQAMLRRQMENRAAVVIQRAWQRYKTQKLYEFFHYKPIPTGPVISSLRGCPLPSISGCTFAYQKSTSITGIMIFFTSYFVNDSVYAKFMLTKHCTDTVLILMADLACSLVIVFFQGNHGARCTKQRKEGSRFFDLPLGISCWATEV